MNIFDMLKIIEKIYNENGYIDNLDIRLFIKSDNMNDKEILNCELEIYNNDSLEICDFISLFKITGNLGEFFLDFINLDTNSLQQLIDDIISIEIMDEITVGFVEHNFSEPMLDLYSNGITNEAITNPNIVDSSLIVLQKLFQLHPYMFSFFNTFSRINLLKEYPLDTIPELTSLIKELNHIIELIVECRKIIDFTYNLQDSYSELEHLNNLTRYYIYTEYALDPRSIFSNLPNRTFEFVHSSPPATIKMGASLKEVINAFSNTKTSFESISYLNLGRNSNTCAESIITLIERKKEIQKCKLCNKYYFAKGRYKSIYCNNIYKDSGRTCQQVAAMKNHKNKTSSNPILREYERAYKRNYARLTNHRLSNEEFRLWVEEATEMRDKISVEYEANPSELIITEFKKYLGNK